MGNLNRWLKYAKAKLDSTVQSSNEELDKAEARLEADRADRPWLAADGDAPTMEEAAARIRWESEDAARKAAAAKAESRPPEDSGPPKPEAPTSADEHAPPAPSGAPGTPAIAAPSAGHDPGRPPASALPDPHDAADPPTTSAPDAGEAGTAPSAPEPVVVPGPFDPATPEEAAARSNAQIELDQRARESAERLEQIRRELGVDPPSGPAPGGS